MEKTLLEPLSKKENRSRVREARQEAFLIALKIDGSPVHACKAAGIELNNVYHWRDKDYRFRDAWKEAEGIGLQKELAGGDDLIKDLGVTDRQFNAAKFRQQILARRLGLTIYEDKVPEQVGNQTIQIVVNGIDIFTPQLPAPAQGEIIDAQPLKAIPEDAGKRR